MSKYLFFCALFFLLILACFSFFAWSWRNELIASFLERSYPPCKATVEHVEWVKKDTIKISEITLQGKDGQEILHISEAKLIAPLSSWLRWFLIPSKKPLTLSLLQLNVTHFSPYTFTPPKAPFLISIEKVVVRKPDGTIKTLTQQSGTLTELFPRRLEL